MDRAQLDEMSKDDLYALATDADVSGRSSMSKSELVDALATDGPGRRGNGGVVAPGGIDPALVAARDNLRQEEAAAAAALEDRPTVGIDERLVAAREETIAADEASETSATAPPSEA